MKKFSLFLAATFLVIFAACSNEESTDNNANSRAGFQQKSGSSRLDSLYNEMVTSSDYIELKSLRNSFNNKMHYTGPMMDLKPGEEFLDWINANISDTDFISYNQAVAEWRLITDKTLLVFQANLGFYDALAAEPEGSKAYYNHLINELPQLTPYQSCSCWDQYQGSVKAATTAFNEAIAKIAKNRFTFGPYNTSKSIADLTEKYSGQLTFLANQYDNCIDDCDED
ncbi:hypothetical protein R1T16_09420 [Flavobacterium sp. DG1-102-2]|uniref:hypothetical protein n=1 Tax=Flavobacterium sp. DG1-102-2 TaxID=3081663 RepID=UPI00294A69CF|nr:hypothetical protein [Flavobacterium sp. DG1-102-2]MDV6168642.1 hypothetical protein [Flavobacterium sp. DG1-102-2]